MIPYARVSHNPTEVDPDNPVAHCSKGRWEAWGDDGEDVHDGALFWISAREYAIQHNPQALGQLDSAWLAYRDADAASRASREYDLWQAIRSDPAIGAFTELFESYGAAVSKSFFDAQNCTINWHAVGCAAAWLAAKTPEERVQIVQAARDGARYSPICPTVETEVTYGQGPMSMTELPPVAQPEPAKPKPAGMSTLGKVALAAGTTALVLVAGIATTRGM